MKITIHWFRRDLRLDDNTALLHALQSGHPVLPLFIFDPHIVGELPSDDARISFIYKKLQGLNKKLAAYGSALMVLNDDPERAFGELISRYEISEVYYNKDYEPYALKRDETIKQMLTERGIAVKAYKDQVIFEENEVVKTDGSPYTVFTPYKNKWLELYAEHEISSFAGALNDNYFRHSIKFPLLNELGFKPSEIRVKDPDFSHVADYARTRDLPAADTTTYVGPHLRFGTVSIRKLVKEYLPLSEVFVSELIWREFFMQILYHFPEVVDHNFRSKYDGIKWRNDEKDFKAWCTGRTGYPMVDAGMRQLNESGFMHNRVRMITAGFLCKHLLIDWRWGEAYFAGKLLDYELASNNGNWQWAAGTGCDAAPYFRVFNPAEQQKKFDKDEEYIRRWIPEYGTTEYPSPLVEHKFARKRALEAYKKGIK